MSMQMTLGIGFEKHTKSTRREHFLGELDRIVCWAELCALIAPVYPVAGKGRRPRDLEMMLRIDCLQQRFELPDPAEHELYDSLAMRRFGGLGEAIFANVLKHREVQGVQLRKDTIVDAPIIAESPSAKNRERARVPDMHQSRKGNQW